VHGLRKNFRWWRFARAVAGSIAACVVASAVTEVRAEEEVKILNVYNWSDYIAPDLIKNFERETGIKVRYDNFDSNEILHVKLVAGKSGYDIVVPSGGWAGMQVQDGLMRKLDKSKLTNLKNLDPAIQTQLAKLDPGNQYLVDWLWGFTTIGVNLDKVRAALGSEPMPQDAWELAFNPRYTAKLKSCGVSMLDSGNALLPAVLLYLGKDPSSSNKADYAAASHTLKSVRSSVTVFTSSAYINDLASGAVCLVVGWSGDINIARQRAIDGKTGHNIIAFLPQRGAPLFFDTMAIPADAPHPGNAHLFINYILRPEVHASLTNTVFYANPNRESMKLVKPELAGNVTIFPTGEALAKMVAPGILNEATRRLQVETFRSFKNGR
jgi:putrescine transport system substrate-binding protein